MPDHRAGGIDMDGSTPGYVVFERICNDILSGAAHWVEREIGCRLFRWEPGRKRPDDAEEDACDEAGDCAADLK